MKKFIWAAVLPLLILLAPSIPAAQASGGCPAPGVYAESQSWWQPAPGTTGGKDFGHVHVGACIPERDVIKANTTIPLQLTMHDNPGKLLDISIVFKGNNQETTVAKAVPSQRTCAMTCMITANAPIDIAKFANSGLQEIRFRVYVDEPDGNRMHTSLNFQTYIANGKAKSDISRMPYLRSKGWYTGFGYCEADITNVPLPDRPVAGTLTMGVQQVDHGSDDVDPSHHSVALDSDAHMGLPGTVLVSGAGALAPTTLRIDTTKLSNGVHKLVQRVECTKGNQMSSGVNVLRFEVAN